MALLSCKVYPRHKSHLHVNYCIIPIHRLNIEIDPQSLFGLHVTWCAQLFSLAETPQPQPSPRLWAHIRGALLVSLDRRHLLVSPWSHPIRERMVPEFSHSAAPCEWRSQHTLLVCHLTKFLEHMKTFFFFKVTILSFLAQKIYHRSV